MESRETGQRQSAVAGTLKAPQPASTARRNGHRSGVKIRRSSHGRVLVLNATYEPINVCSIRRATVLVLKERAEILERGEWELRSESLTLPQPAVIRLVTYVKIPRARLRRKITRRAIFARDRWMCQYCGTKAHLTVDHIVPRSRGGESSWENIATSCSSCNRHKGNRIPREAGMKLLRPPKSPAPHIFVYLASPRVPTVWQQYLQAA